MSDSRFLLDLYTSRPINVCMWLAHHQPNFIQIEPPRSSYDVTSISQDGGHGVANITPVSRSVTHSLDISIYGRVISTSGFRKQTSAILKLYFRFTMWLQTSLWHNALYNTTTFHRHVTIYAKVINIYRKSNMASAAIFYQLHESVLEKIWQQRSGLLLFTVTRQWSSERRRLWDHKLV